MASLRALTHEDWHSLEEADRVVRRAGNLWKLEPSKGSLPYRMSLGMA